MEKEDNYELYFDGSAHPNPGMAGSAYVIYCNNIKIHENSIFLGNNLTNNYAEYSSILYGLQRAIQLKIKKLTVKGDSLLVINQINGIYKVKSDNLKQIYNSIKNLQKWFDEIVFIHIPREQNTVADKLANEVIDKYYKIDNKASS
jgi:ribonuclease HI